MSTTPAVKDPGCTVDTDGNLKDASEIEWHYDKDDVDLMPGPSSSSNPTKVSSFFFKKTSPYNYYCWLLSVHPYCSSLCAGSWSRECNECPEAKGSISPSISCSYYLRWWRWCWWVLTVFSNGKSIFYKLDLRAVFDCTSLSQHSTWKVNH